MKKLLLTSHQTLRLSAMVMVFLLPVLVYLHAGSVMLLSGVLCAETAACVILLLQPIKDEGAKLSYVSAASLSVLVPAFVLCDVEYPVISFAAIAVLFIYILSRLAERVSNLAESGFRGKWYPAESIMRFVLSSALGMLVMFAMLPLSVGSMKYVMAVILLCFGLVLLWNGNTVKFLPDNPVAEEAPSAGSEAEIPVADTGVAARTEQESSEGVEPPLVPEPAMCQADAVAAHAVYSVTEEERLLLEEGIIFPAREHVRETEEDVMRDLYGRALVYMKTIQPFLNENFSLTDMSMNMLSNKSYLSKTINRYFGNNFRQFVNSFRVNYAIEVMNRDPNVKMEDLAIMSGFHSSTSFNLAFKLKMNITPSEYARTLRLHLRAGKFHVDPSTTATEQQSS